jgi:hypothetical protein
MRLNHRPSCSIDLIQIKMTLSEPVIINPDRGSIKDFVPT